MGFRRTSRRLTAPLCALQLALSLRPAAAVEDLFPSQMEDASQYPFSSWADAYTWESCNRDDHCAGLRKAALRACEKSLVTGAGIPCTRAMTVDCLWKAAGSPVPFSAAVFTDVPANAPYAQAVKQGVTTGTFAAAFSPGAVGIRRQIVTFFHRAYA